MFEAVRVVPALAAGGVSRDARSGRHMLLNR